MRLFSVDLHGCMERRFHLRLFAPPPTVRLFESDFVNYNSMMKNVWIHGRAHGGWCPAVSPGERPGFTAVNNEARFSGFQMFSDAFILMNLPDWSMKHMDTRDGSASLC